MKTSMIVLATVAVLVGANYATASHDTASLTIKKRVVKLERQIRVLNREVGFLQGAYRCTASGVGITSYGNPTPNPAEDGKFGYYWIDNSGPTIQSSLVTALDFSETPEDTDVFVPVIDKSCLGQAKSFKVVKP